MKSITKLNLSHNKDGKPKMLPVFIVWHHTASTIIYHSILRGTISLNSQAAEWPWRAHRETEELRADTW